jgi:hypothetical protein
MTLIQRAISRPHTMMIMKEFVYCCSCMQNEALEITIEIYHALYAAMNTFVHIFMS